MSDKIGEVIEASTRELMAECYELYDTPPFGSFVKTTDGAIDIFGVVNNAVTESIEPGRRPVARGKNETDEAEIYRQNPQLSKLLRTEFNVIVVGYREKDNIYQYLPPRPARVHSFVYLCNNDELREFTSSLNFLSMLINTGMPGIADELIAACIRSSAQAYDDKHNFLVTAGKQLVVLLNGELHRLDAILRRIKQ